jgi:hypothetical protein
MRADSLKLAAGVGLLALFAVVLVLFFLPVVDGLSPMKYLDSLYNSISKQSAYHIPGLREEVHRQQDRNAGLTVAMEDSVAAAEVVSMLGAAGVEVRLRGAEMEIPGELRRILTVCLEDSDLMFSNDGAALTAKYGIDGKKALFRWWQLLKQIDKGLKRESRFDEAKVVCLVSAKALESAYNYYGIEPVRITDKLVAVICSLAFYVLYTVWYGYAIIFIFEGCGLKLSH